MQPKPVYEVMRRLIRERWWTRLEEKTDAAGQVKFRGFKGQYRLTVTGPDGRKVEQDFALPGEPCEVRLTRAENP